MRLLLLLGFTLNPFLCFAVAAESDQNIDPEKRSVEPIKTPHNNLWLKVKHQLSWQTRIHHTVEKRRYWYLKHPHYMEAVSQRAQPYLHHIISAIEQQNLPMELALLPIIESGYQNNAYSSKGAAGIWQLMPKISKYYDLQINHQYDARLDVISATSAALKYLTYLHQEFKQDWLLAIAAYNCGEGVIKKAIQRNKEKGKSTDFWSLTLPQETRDYVPKLLAISSLLKDTPNNFNWPAIPLQPNTSIVNINQQFDMLVIAKTLNIDMRTLYQFNPAYLTEQSPEHGPYHLLLPNTDARKLKQTLAIARLAQNQGLYEVQKGDSLYFIARTFQTNITQLKQLNGLSSDLIKIGQQLIVPTQQAATALILTKHYHISPYLMRAAPLETEMIQLTHRIRKGDTLWKIAQLYDVSHKDIAVWNQLALSSPLKIATTLIIWKQQVITQQKVTAQPILFQEKLQNLTNNP